MFNTALHRLLGAAYGPTYRLAGIGAWIFGGYGLLILAMAMAAGRTAESFAVYGKPHGHDHGTDEHTEIIAALRAGDAQRAVATMDHHMELVERRAIADEMPAESLALGDVLSRYAEAINARQAATPLAKAKRK